MTTINGDELPTIETDRLRLRPLDERDAPNLFAIYADPEVMRYWSTPPWTDAIAALKLVDDVRRGFLNRTLYQWGIAHRENNALIGTCTLCNLHHANRRAEIGFTLERSQWGNGYMREAVGCLLEFAFDKLNLHRLEADVDPRNAPSLRLLEHLGFAREGLLRERWLVGDEINDSVICGLLAKDWRARQQSRHASRGAAPDGASHATRK